VSLGVAQAVAEIISALDAHGIPYAVIGGFALQAYGIVRATQDIDFIIPAKHQDDTVAVLTELGFSTLHRSAGYSNHVRPGAVPVARVDCVYVKGPTAQELMGAAKKTLRLGAAALPVVAPAHLVALKVFAFKCNPDRRLQELADIRRLMHVGAVARDEVRELFERYGQMDAFTELMRE
jgi:hypothetical protein